MSPQIIYALIYAKMTKVSSKMLSFSHVKISCLIMALSGMALIASFAFSHLRSFSIKNALVSLCLKHLTRLLSFRELAFGMF